MILRILCALDSIVGPKRMARRKDERFAVFRGSDFLTGQDCRGEWAQGQLLLSPLSMLEINFQTNFP
ncbi:hypothetical protein [Noviherbaspirillum sp. UKPF54]|uniref:hypothetical protein n=1 Tax=Noviherbaspirillum sp. UKPF54 TaxID=2601898 RepID=UPI0011B124EF|nr:hypothetical protein [Noviherbaspirillum sp. UKPF54]QDZ27329.1 hypothetical protein FAY22_04790 [Noviherbaspirillum sp. UKPF54]